ncbi:phenylalanyl-tRNA synthetase, alpha subunit [Alkalithermobacter thermoalcaliphilus JW-YL-7 = DSM 7308]|uniref:Phenylalanine--tRNA ligase alpha subunit n=1 Tax=Alkalithermobacter thermoalcaliphilus JW-YL-7 = DSM 7308 TaxID=1121328 RepID=A0A150FNW9_CLOPD|nr:Phenylalanyl-tRNA synthetase alpha chain [[Clostridium] paradoxum JW-YL-7 = DSM 7308]SHK55433.1 phenylalanyl-tRNA synthetase, alpha subunit [[Clostridium] paradoxum JW-YL-7 = DSM 7308]
MKEQLLSIKENALLEINQCTKIEDIENVRVKYLGKKGEITNILKGMGKLSQDERPIIGKIVNTVREELEESIRIKKDHIKENEKYEKLRLETIDVTMPSRKRSIGKKHPITQIMDELKYIFTGMGFKVAEGPEIETVYNNFDALNAPKNHPSREMSDTFYINENLLLRTQTSPVQIRAMKAMPLPIKIISPGRCFRFDAPDATHSPMFHQLEGLVIDKDINMTHLKGTLDAFVKQFFGESTKTKFRPHNFPFTEPSAEVDVTCFKCKGTGCSMCKGEGWIEILGAGMVHPNVLRNCGIDPNEYSGFAFGMGIDRIAMLKYEIDDIRLLFENDMRFLNQF